MKLLDSFARKYLVAASTETGMRRLRISALLLFVAQSRKWTGKCLNMALRLEGGPFFSVTARLIMSARFGVEIGDYSYGPCFEPGTFASGTRIGRYVSLGPRIRAYTANHPIDRLTTHPFFFNHELGYVPHTNVPFTQLTIEDDAWVGDSVIITPGCAVIGRGAVVGAGSVVTKNVPEYAIVAGVPARILRYRFTPELRQEVRDSAWWRLPLPVLLRNVDHLSRPLSFGAASRFAAEQNV